jgi:putative inorganic carbon (hco3(-)) transporter
MSISERDRLVVSGTPRFAWGGILVAVAASILSGIALASGASRTDVVLPIAAAGVLALGVLAVSRFALFVAIILMIRPLLDAVKVGSETSGADPSAAISLLFVLAAGFWLLAQPGQLAGSLGSPLARPMIAFVAAGAISVAASEAPLTSAVELMRIATVAVILVVLDRLLQDRRRIRLVLLAVFASALVPVLIGFYQQLTGGGVVLAGGFSRVRWTFLHPNPFASYLTMLLILGAAVYPHLQRRLHRLGLVALLAACAPLLILTYTRGAWIAAGAGLLLVGLIQSRRLVGALIIVVAVVLLAVPSVTGRFADLSQERRPSGAPGNSLAWRFGYWEETLALAENPVTGIGLRMVQANTEAQKQPHNDFLRVYVETGILGLLAYLWLLSALIRTAWRVVVTAPDGLARGLAVAFAGAVVAFITLSLVANVISQLVILWYFAAIAAMAVAAARPSPQPAGAPR